MNSSNWKCLSSQLLFSNRQYRSCGSFDEERAGQWWHTRIPFHEHRWNRNSFLSQLQSPRTSVRAHLWANGFPASWHKRGKSSSWYGPVAGWYPLINALILHVTLRITTFNVKCFHSWCSGIENNRKRLALTLLGFHKTKLNHIPIRLIWPNLVATLAPSP